ANGTASPFAFGDVTVYPAELRARRGEETIDLSLREVAILQLLHERRGEVVSRDAFFDVCWGLDFVPNSRTLDQHISQLRKRLEPDPKRPRLIRTVHGAGYRYEG
ncbi:MAG TPA: winged helix-turn-helix domain-containing protein, partial [Candidatus Hydrogenedentes bacterium]|nr:winged helix-turn-helix domain-containing protein [Candidatus Hydrogenedentota bacterium]